MVRAKELFTWNPTFLLPKAIVYSSDDDSVQADNENDLHPGDNDVEGGDDNASTDDGVAETVFDTGVIGEQHSVDPFELYGLLNKRKQAEEANEHVNEEGDGRQEDVVSPVVNAKKVSHSIFVTNFPESVTPSDLWRVCGTYGTVVDVFIPVKRSKVGKRFAFVRFIKVIHLDRLVKNLCTLWIGNYHLYANQVQFERPQINQFPPLNGSSGVSKNQGLRQPHGSYAKVVNATSLMVNASPLLSSAPALVLDNACIVERDLSKHIMGRVKDFNSIPNLLPLLSAEGFTDVKLVYLGGMWVMFEFEKVESKMNMIAHPGVASWFHVIHESSNDFVSDERIVWVDIEGVSLHAWSCETFSRIGKKWGETLNIEDTTDHSFGRKRLCLATKNPVSIIETFKIIVKGKVFMVRAKELFTWNPTFLPPRAIVYSSDDDSVQADNENDVHPGDNDVEGGDDNASTDDGVAETVFDTGVIGEQHSVDPFELYGLLNKRKQAEEVNVSSSSLSYPPGFTPVGSVDPKTNEHVNEEGDGRQEDVVSPVVNAKVMNISQDVEEEVSCVFVKTGGSVLGVLEEVIRVGQAMGFFMEGCKKDVENIIGNERDETVFK
nr:RNA-directed DNA polymerase, eukaryota, nucleotide-binding alpha-beta plait domain protein [Tanacetum cinerariifolium]